MATDGSGRQRRLVPRSELRRDCRRDNAGLWIAATCEAVMAAKARQVVLEPRSYQPKRYPRGRTSVETRRPCGTPYSEASSKSDERLGC